jgi:hypothetical protein
MEGSLRVIANGHVSYLEAQFKRAPSQKTVNGEDCDI